MALVYCSAMGAHAQETLSVISTNDGSGSFGWVFSSPSGPLVFTEFQMRLPGVQETFPPAGWEASLVQNDLWSWEFVGPNGSVFTGDPMAFAVRSTISDSASYKGLAAGEIFVMLFPYVGPGTPSLAIAGTPTNTVAVSWDSPSTGWTLQQHTNLVTTNWVSPAETIIDDGTKKFIIVNPSVGNRFYRLFKP